MAKEQGFRSRAAFKLIQINRQYSILEKCSSAVLDLCAAPGGWTQVAARTCPSSCQIIAVDILPLRPLSDRRITTIVGDITTDKCRADIQRALKNDSSGVDLVLHDGAPNVGADYSKDAFVQNELTLAAMRTAVQHLKAGGTFITKVYRSRDYHALHWAISQLFDTVDVYKPAASRQQSAEIFLMGRHYKAPKSVDPRLTDPKHVFAMMAEDTTPAAVSVFSSHQPKRHRQGYDTEHFSFTSLRRVEPVRNFIQAPSVKQAIQLLSTSTELSFTCASCGDDGSCAVCTRYLQQAPPEIQEHCSDLKLLNKADFKRLLLWRNRLFDEETKGEFRGDDSNTAGGDEKGSTIAKGNQSDDDEEAIQKEVELAKALRLREAKRRRKKEARLAASRRRKAALGMNLNAIEITDNDHLFSLAGLGPNEISTEVNLDVLTDEQIFGSDDHNTDVFVGGEDDIEGDDEQAQQKRRERDLEEAYAQYLQNTKSSIAGTKAAKRSKKLERQKLIDEAHEDQEMAMNKDLSYNVKTYAKMLRGNESDDDNESNSADDDESNDGFNDPPMTAEEHRAAQEMARNPLMHQFSAEEPNTKTARWFSNPLFKTIEKAVASAPNICSVDEGKPSGDTATNSVSSKPVDDDAKEKGNSSLTAEEVIASIPRTDKEKRHEKRLKQMEKDKKKKEKKQQDNSEYQLVPATPVPAEAKGDMLSTMTEEERQKELRARELIKSGFGGDAATVENAPLPVMDTRKFESDAEDYDSDDHAKTLAIGTMILRRSKEKAFVDASYNRYAWNDPSDLPEWFVDDEARNYRPQLPIPPALLAKMKEKMMACSTKPIAKVAEARARKHRRAKLKLAAAKKKAEAVAYSNEMTESMKLKAISHALRGQETKKPGKTYVVAKKGGTNKAGKGAKLVDKRMKNDKRAMNRADKKRKKGKQRTMVGSKKRRHHS